MKKIRKYTLRRRAVQTFHDIPFDAKILSIQQQGAEMCMWVEVDPGEKVSKMLAIITVLTGENAPDSRRAEYITTCQHGSSGLVLVLHYYRLKV